MPLLTIGLPTSATAAVILTAFQSYGLQPGPQLFEESGPLVYALLASLYIGNVMLLVLNLPLARVWARLLQIPAYAHLRRHPRLRDARHPRHRRRPWPTC